MPTKNIELPTQLDLDQFISFQAHDLRTPFNHIIGFSKMTLNTITEAPLTAFQKEDIGTVYRSGLRALGLMNGLIDIARLNRHEKELSLTDILLQGLLDQSLAQWKKFNPASEAQIETNIRTASATLHGDDPLLRQVIVGFANYVLQFCEGKCKLTISVDDAANKVVFSFTSAGSKARLPSQLDLDMLGYVSRRLVELHSGEIVQAVETDEGACIQFSLPKAA